MRIGVITIVSGRRDHLLNQHRALAIADVKPHSYTVVAMNEPDVSRWLPETEPVARIVDLYSPGTQLPLATARNAGARRAIDDGAELLVFLDVDCVPSPTLLSSYADASARHPGSLLSGAVGYLPDGVDAFATDRSAVAHFHGFRPRLAPGEVTPADPNLFWSLSFALTSDAWRRSGGFHEKYRGYGAEDTDFASVAEQAGLDFAWVGGAEAFHQYHPTETPPVRHLDDILRNGALFAKRWGSWPMSGWLEAFESKGLVTRDRATGNWQKAETV